MGIGVFYALIGAAIAVTGGIGSAIGVTRASNAAAALLCKDPSKFGNVLLIQLLPSSQAIYGFVVAVFAFIDCGLMGGSVAATTPELGLAILAACLPMGINGVITGILQGGVAVSGVNLVGKQEGQLGKVVIMVVLSEIFVIFAFIISLLALIFLAPVV